MPLKLLHLVTTYQRVVTILEPKLALLEAAPGVALNVASSPPEEGESRKARGIYHALPIARTIRPLLDALSIIRLFRLIRSEKYDIVHTHTAKAGIVGAMACKFAGVPLVCHTYHGLPFYDGQGRVGHALYRFIELFFSYWRQVVLSQNKRDYLKLMSMPRLYGKVVFEGNGVRADWIRTTAEAHKAEVSGIFEGETVKLLCVARLERVKRIDKVIDLVKDLRAAALPVDCVIAGQGELKEELEQRISALGLEKNIRIVYTPHIHALILQSDIVLLTSEKEGVPRGLMEAMALAKPIVATDVLGTQELVVHEQTGFLVSLDDQTGLAAAVKRLIDDPELRLRFGQAGRERVLQHYNEEAIVGKWLAIYRRELAMRTMTSADLLEVARLHRLSIPVGFLSSLGDRFLSAMYHAIARQPGSCVLVERDAAGRIIGFVAGSLSTRRCLKRVVAGNLFSLGFPIVRRAFSFSTLRRIAETLLYPSRQSATEAPIEAELLSIAVSSEARGMGVGKKLVVALEEFYRERGLEGAYKVVTSAEDERSNAFYEKAGFVFYRNFYHHGRPMKEYRKNLLITTCK